MPKIFRTIDWVTYLIPILLLAISVSLIFSLVFSGDDTSLSIKQLIFGVTGIGLMVVFSLIDYRNLRGLWWLFYLISVILLIYVDVFGKVSGGAMRWIDLGFVQIQPSEIAKVSIIIAIATFFSSQRQRLSFSVLALSLIYFSIPFVLILKEPDLGTAIVALFIYIGILFSAKPSKGQSIAILAALFLIISLFVLSAINIYPFNSLLKGYQRDRILTFINPDKDPKGLGYNVKQAQIAIGSGGMLGKGLGRGSQSQLEFLPKPQTDFIFAGAGESMGFLGSSLIIFLLLFLTIKIYSIGQQSQDKFGMLLCSGAAAMFLSQSAINIGMNLGLAPVTGIPLPFMSAGGTALVIYFCTIGIVQSVYIRHKKLSFS